jgi:riboflavin kinase/FMN adenylyltransferase
VDRDSRRIDGVCTLDVPPGGTLVAIGNFDGVHLGHRAVLRVCAEEARARALAPLVLTFHPHPAQVLGRSRGAPLLTTIEHRIALISDVDPMLRVVVEPFTLELAALSPREFVEQILVAGLGARKVVVGDDFHYGVGRSGSLSTLQTLGDELGFEAQAVALLLDTVGDYSSTRVRAAVIAGDVVAAERMLGRPHSVEGTVVPGDGRGRILGVPTANLDQIEELLPLGGVYACQVDARGCRRPGVVNIGTRPTIGGRRRTVEVHLIDFTGDLYGERLGVHFLLRLREERTFAGVDELVAQIRLDLGKAREIATSRLYLSGHSP